VRTTFESGGWVEHTPIQDLKGGHKRALTRAGKARLDVRLDDDGQVDLQQALAGLDMMGYAASTQDALWALLIDKWSYDLPVPVLDRASGTVEGADAFDELPLADFEAVERLFEPFARKLSRRPDPKGTTTSASNGSSPASAAHGSPKG
jgi:hypothetical protein